MSKRQSQKSDGTALIITAEQTAKILGVTKRVIYGMVQSWAFPDGVVVRSGRAIFFLRPRLLEWVGLSRNGADDRAVSAR